MLIKNLKSATKSFEKTSIPGNLGVSDIKEFYKKQFGEELESFEFYKEASEKDTNPKLEAVGFEHLSVGDSYYVNDHQHLIYTSPKVLGWQAYKEASVSDGYVDVDIFLATEEFLQDKNVCQFAFASGVKKHMLLGCDTAGFYIGPSESLEYDSNNVHTGADGYFGEVSELCGPKGDVCFIHINIQMDESMFEEADFDIF